MRKSIQKPSAEVILAKFQLYGPKWTLLAKELGCSPVTAKRWVEQAMGSDTTPLTNAEVLSTNRQVHPRIQRFNQRLEKTKQLQQMR